jgi:hypothetical protein
LPEGLFVLLEIKRSAGMMAGFAISSLITSVTLLSSYFPHVRSRRLSVNEFASFRAFSVLVAPGGSCVGGSFFEFGNVKCLGRGAALRPLDLTPCLSFSMKRSPAHWNRWLNSTQLPTAMKKVLDHRQVPALKAALFANPPDNDTPSRGALCETQPRYSFSTAF